MENTTTEKKDEILSLMADYINAKEGFEYSLMTDDLCLINNKERYEHRVALDDMLSKISNMLTEVGYTIYVWE